MLNIAPDLLEEHGMVSEVTALEMADKSLAHTSAHYAIAITGLAGPSGDGTGVSVGELWIAWADKVAGLSSAEQFHLDCDRQSFRTTACRLAVDGFVKRYCTA